MMEIIDLYHVLPKMAVPYDDLNGTAIIILSYGLLRSSYIYLRRP